MFWHLEGKGNRCLEDKGAKMCQLPESYLG